MKKIENKIKILTEKIKDQNDTKNEILFLNEMKKNRNREITLFLLSLKTIHRSGNNVLPL